MSESFIGNPANTSTGNRRRRGGSKYPAPIKCKSSHLQSNRLPSSQLSRFTEVADVYRTVLGPTTDETILAGLQTVMDMCLLPTQHYNSQSEYSSETNYSALSDERAALASYQAHYDHKSVSSSNSRPTKSTACMTEGRCHLQCTSV